MKRICQYRRVSTCLLLVCVGGWMVTGCQTKSTTTRTASLPRAANRPPAADAASAKAFFTVRSLDQNGTRENARKAAVPTYELHLRHPVFAGPAGQALNRVIRDYIVSAKDEFVQSTINVDTDQMGAVGFPWRLDIRFSLPHCTPRFVSLLLTRTLSDSHGQVSMDFFAVNYDFNQQKELLLADILATPFALNSLSAMVINRLKEQPNLATSEALLQKGAGPQFDNFANFNLSRKALVIQFAAGQVAENVSGPQLVELPLSQVSALLQPEIPRALMEESN